MHLLVLKHNWPQHYVNSVRQHSDSVLPYPSKESPLSVNPVMIFPVERCYITFDSISYLLFHTYDILFCNWKFESLALDFLICGQLLYKIMWFLHVCQQESAIGIRITPLFRTPLHLTLPHPSRLSRSAWLERPAPYSKFPLPMWFTPR